MNNSNRLLIEKLVSGKYSLPILGGKLITRVIPGGAKRNSGISIINALFLTERGDISIRRYDIWFWLVQVRFNNKKKLKRMMETKIIRIHIWKSIVDKNGIQDDKK